MVHASMRAVGCNSNDFVRALLDVADTVLAYVDWEMPSEDAPFDPHTAPAAKSHGVLAETIRAWPGAVRSAHPDAGFSAVDGTAEGGTSRARAAWLVADQPFDYGYGERSPLGKLVEAGGKVLVLGAPLDTITLLHFSEHAAAISGKRIVHYKRLMLGGWTSFEEFDTCDPPHPSLPDDYFARVAEGFLATGAGAKGTVGGATSYLFDARALHAFGVAWLERTLA